MQTIAQDNPFADTITTIHAGSTRALWTGRVISGLAVAFLIFDSVGKLLEVQPVIDGTKQLGYPPDIVFSLGVSLLSCVLAYLVPQDQRTARAAPLADEPRHGRRVVRRQRA